MANKAADGDKPTLTKAETARMLGISTSNVTIGARSYLDTGGKTGIPCLKAGDRYVFSRKSIVNFLETGSFDGVQKIDVPEIVRQTLAELLEAHLQGVGALVGILRKDKPKGGIRREK